MNILMQRKQLIAAGAIIRRAATTTTNTTTTTTTTNWPTSARILHGDHRQRLLRLSKLWQDETKIPVDGGAPWVKAEVAQI